MKRTVNLPEHFEGDIHINVGNKAMKFTIKKTDAAPDAAETDPEPDEDGNICYMKCFKKDRKGNCIDWRIVCHAPGSDAEWEK